MFHGFRRLSLGRGGHVGVGVQGKPGIVVAQHSGHGFHIHSVLQSQGGEGVPSQYNCDKPEKPVVSRALRFSA